MGKGGAGGWWVKRRSESGADWLERLGTGRVETQNGSTSRWVHVSVGMTSSFPTWFLFWRIFLPWDVDVSWAAVDSGDRAQHCPQVVQVHLCNDLFSHVLNITAATVIRGKCAHSDLVASSHTSPLITPKTHRNYHSLLISQTFLLPAAGSCFCKSVPRLSAAVKSVLRRDSGIC